jgi:Co/Zn/Cd efflux system component
VNKTTFRIRKMDCASEEQLIRLKLEDFKNISSLHFDIPDRRLDVYHTGDYRPIFDEINKLQFDTSYVESNTIEDHQSSDKIANERNLLLQVLSINFFFFLLEILTGFISDSMGLVADSLDMLADSLVYGLAIYAIGGTITRKKNIAKASGYFQLLLAIIGIIEVIRRFIGFGDVPEFRMMIVISTLALIGNLICLVLLQKSKSTEAHIQASMIFTSNDVVINLSVIIAGVLVFMANSKIPDLIIGGIVFYIVARGAYRILQISK